MNRHQRDNHLFTSDMVHLFVDADDEPDYSPVASACCMCCLCTLPVQCPHSETHLVLNCNKREVLPAFLSVSLLAYPSLIFLLLLSFEPGELTDEPPTGATQPRPHKYVHDGAGDVYATAPDVYPGPGHLEEHGRQRVKLLDMTDGAIDPPDAAATG